jgi:hypothetical protein
MNKEEEWQAYMKPLEPGELARAFVQVERAEYSYTWPVHAHEGQLGPPGDWSVWLIMAGRGFGKTRAGAEWVRQVVDYDGPIARLRRRYPRQVGNRPRIREPDGDRPFLLTDRGTTQ